MSDWQRLIGAALFEASSFPTLLIHKCFTVFLHNASLVCLYLHWSLQKWSR